MFLIYAEITAFSDRHAEFDKINTEILGVSVDSVVYNIHSIRKLFHDAFVVNSYILMLK